MRNFVKASLAILAVSVGSISLAQGQPTLKGAFGDSFRTGVALNQAQILEQDTRGAALVKAQFDSISPENCLKWEVVHPELKQFDFQTADRYVAFGEQNHMQIIGHTLVWHSQTPKWVFEDGSGKPLSREMLLQQMREHIRTVVGRYKGRIKGWDVVNEAVDEDGTLRQSPWMKIIGEDYIAKAYEFAHEADPAAELYYNDYSLENEQKRKGALALIKKLQAGGIHLNAVGLQGHYKLNWPTLEQFDSTISDFARLGVKVNVTEFDIDVLPATGNGADVGRSVESQAELDPYKSGLPVSVQQALTKRYADLFGVLLKHKGVIERVTFWGLTDGDSWLNNWPVKGRTSYPLLFDRGGQPKPAFFSVIKSPDATAR